MLFVGVRFLLLGCFEAPRSILLVVYRYSICVYSVCAQDLISDIFAGDICKGLC